MSDTIAVPAELASCTREGFHIELGNAAEQLAGFTERAGERSFELYRNPLVRLAEAQAVLEEVGGETPDPPVAIELDRRHRPILLDTLTEQRQSYTERLDELSDRERRAAIELLQGLTAFIRVLKSME